MHRLVIEGVATIVYAIIVRTYTAFKSSAWTKLVRSKKIARANIKLNINTSYFSMLNQIANLQIRDFAKASSWFGEKRNKILPILGLTHP